jgi:hypothetical protein
MATARELLEQADALMRRNRGDTGIPVLTDSVPDAAPAPVRGPSTRDRAGPAVRAQAADARTSRDRGQREETPRGAESARASAAPAPVEPPTRPPDALATGERRADPAEPPLLTDAVEEVVSQIPISRHMTPEDDLSLWLGPDTTDPSLHSITGPAPDTLAVVPPVTLRAPGPTAEAAAFEDDRDPTVTRTLRAAGSAPTPPPAGSAPQAGSAPSEPAEPPEPPEPPESPPAALHEPVALGIDDERWRALAEQISMQVLQRLDLFVDTGLKAQLAAHLQPIVARASAELVETINDHVGQLVRTYVAEAIEREIAQWRQQNK